MRNGTVQWSMLVQVIHGPGFGHSVECSVNYTGKPRENFDDTLGTWQGVGVPESLLKEMRGYVDAIFSEYMIRRYSVSMELPNQWEVEPGTS